MIDQPKSAFSVLFAEPYQETFEEQWKQLADMKLVLEQKFGQDLTVDFVSNMIVRIQEMTMFISTLPENILAYLTSRDALLEYLQKSSIELYLLRDQLALKGKTRRCYTHLLACQRHLERGLEQRRKAPEEWQAITWERTSATHENMLVCTATTAIVSLRHGREFQRDLYRASKVLSNIKRVFYEGLEVWPDQCTHSLMLLRDIQEVVRETCSFLDSLAGSHAALSSHYCQLIVTLHHVSEQTRITSLHMTRYRMICRSSSSRSISTKQTIIDVLAELVQYTDMGTQGLTMLLDQAHFQERKAHEEQTGTYFA